MTLNVFMHKPMHTYKHTYIVEIHHKEQNCMHITLPEFRLRSQNFLYEFDNLTSLSLNLLICEMERVIVLNSLKCHEN